MVGSYTLEGISFELALIHIINLHALDEVAFVGLNGVCLVGVLSHVGYTVGSDSTTLVAGCRNLAGLDDVEAAATGDNRARIAPIVVVAAVLNVSSVAGVIVLGADFLSCFMSCIHLRLSCSSSFGIAGCNSGLISGLSRFIFLLVGFQIRLKLLCFSIGQAKQFLNDCDLFVSSGLSDISAIVTRRRNLSCCIVIRGFQTLVGATIVLIRVDCGTGVGAVARSRNTTAACGGSVGDIIGLTTVIAAGRCDPAARISGDVPGAGGAVIGGRAGAAGCLICQCNVCLMQRLTSGSITCVVSYPPSGTVSCHLLLNARSCRGRND